MTEFWANLIKSILWWDEKEHSSDKNRHSLSKNRNIYYFFIRASTEIGYLLIYFYFWFIFFQHIQKPTDFLNNLKFLEVKMSEKFHCFNESFPKCDLNRKCSDLVKFNFELVLKIALKLVTKIWHIMFRVEVLLILPRGLWVFSVLPFINIFPSDLIR